MRFCVATLVLLALVYCVAIGPAPGPNTLGTPRSGAWPRVRAEHLAKQPACEACGYRKPPLHVHHVKPFHVYPELELEPSNLITLCPWCHLHHGHDRDGYWGNVHRPNWTEVNTNVRRDAAAWLGGKR